MKHRNLLVTFFVLVAVLVLVFALLFFIPTGNWVRVVSQVNEDSIVITNCGIQTTHFFHMEDPENTVSTSYRVLILTVLDGETQVASRYEDNIGIGTCVIFSSHLPSGLSPNTELTVTIELWNSMSDFVAQDQTTINYK